ncbi:OadG-related small transporter subunit [Solitalea canadensis]|nr:OadG-related small transporter subunit [Solitalea canadensis]
MTLLTISTATNNALTVSAVGIAAIFVFMFIFYISIRLIDKFFPGEF